MYKSARTSSVCSAMEYSCNSGIVNNSDHVIWRGWDYYVEWVKYLSIIMKCVSLMHICENNYFVGNRHISQLAYIFIRHFSLIIHHVSAQSFVNWTLKIWSSPSNLILATVLPRSLGNTTGDNSSISNIWHLVVSTSNRAMLFQCHFAH